MPGPIIFEVDVQIAISLASIGYLGEGAPNAEKYRKIIQRSRRDFAAGRSRSLAEVRELFGLPRGANKRMQPLARRARRG